MLVYKAQIAECIIRIFTGVLFFFQGYDKVFKVKISGVVNTFLEDAEHMHIHKPLVTLISFYTSFIELAAGFLLIVGLLTNYALLGLGIDLVLVGFAFSLIRPMWDLQYVFPRLLLVFILLILPNEYNTISLDYLLNFIGR